MASANASPVRFGSILLLHLCICGVGVLLQNAYEHWDPAWFGFLLGMVLVGGGALGFAARRFLWDVFRSFKSAGVILTLLVLSCVLGTLIIQDLDLRRDNVFDKGITADGKPPPFESSNMPTRFALAQSHAMLWASPTEERRRQYEEKVRLSPVEQQQVGLRARAFGERAAKAYEEAILASKKRGVDQLTTSNFARKHREGFYDAYLWARRLRLIDIFEAWWFYMLLGLIAVNVTVGTFARAPWNARDLGIAVTHAGILIILTGSLLDLLKAKEGYIYFTYGRPEEQVSTKIYDQKNQLYHHLPFQVRLDRFATEHYHELLVRRVDWSRRSDGSGWEEAEGAGTPFSVYETFPVREGVPGVFEDGEVKVTVHEYKPRVFVENDVADDAGGRPNPAIKLGVYREARRGPNLLVGANADPWLFAFRPGGSALDVGAGAGDVRFDFVYARSAEEYDERTRRAPIPDNGTLVVRVGGEELTVPVVLGGRKRVQVGERGFAIEFLAIQSALAESENVNLDQRLQRSEEPVLFLRVDGKDALVPRDDREFLEGFDLLPGMKLRFDWPDPRDRGVFQIYRVVAGDGRPTVLVQADGEGSAVVEPLGGEAAAPLSGHLEGLFLGIEKAVRSARPERAVREVTDEQFLREGGGAQDHLLAAWADIEIRGPKGTIRKELTPFDPPLPYGEVAKGRPLYTFELVKTRMARDWFSVLSVRDAKGEVKKTHVVQVNSPLRYAGYRFFQATAQEAGQGGLAVSGISVTRNPGVNFMYVGYAVLTLGVCWIFFWKPILVRRGRRRRREEAVSS